MQQHIIASKLVTTALELNSNGFFSVYDLISGRTFSTKECGFLEQLVISFTMLPNIVGRALCLGVVFGLMKIYIYIHEKIHKK